MLTQKFAFNYNIAQKITELTEQQQRLVAEAYRAAENSFSPHSHFAVGAAARLSTGEILVGNNQESDSFPAGLCAERTLLGYIGANRTGIDILEIAVGAIANGKHMDVTPCGICRQTLVDMQARQNQPIKLILSGAQSIMIIDDASMLLPLNFKL